MDEDVQLRRIVKRVVRAQDKVLGADDIGAGGRRARDGPAVLRVLLRPVRKQSRSRLFYGVLGALAIRAIFIAAERC
jgi:hypothetical protein